jgi:membrane-associated phospholipid phosphatase
MLPRPAGAAALPICMGGLRVGAGNHFPSDVFVGMIVGGACGILVPHWMRR